jgi:aminoglycoside phosphotransferase (APT) family kinase protein
MKKPTLDNGEIQRIFSNLALDLPFKIKEISAGSINPVYSINDKYILRIDPLIAGSSEKFAKEVFLFKLLIKHDIPVPKVIAYDNSCSLIKYSYMIMEQMRGDNLLDVYHVQPEDIQDQLALELGIVVKKINTITTLIFQMTDCLTLLNTG